MEEQNGIRKFGSCRFWNLVFTGDFFYKKNYYSIFLENIELGYVNVYVFGVMGCYYLYKQKRRKVSMKPVVKKNQGNIDHVTGDKIPKSFVFSRGKLPSLLKQLQMDLRKLMLPYTALNLRVMHNFHVAFYSSDKVFEIWLGRIKWFWCTIREFML